MINKKGRAFRYILIFIVLASILLSTSCEPVGDYLVEIVGVSYFDEYVYVTLSPAYDSLSAENFTLTNSDGEEIFIKNVRYNKEGENITYFLFNEKDPISLEDGNYILTISKIGFRFIHSDVLKESNTYKLKVDHNIEDDE